MKKTKNDEEKNINPNNIFYKNQNIQENGAISSKNIFLGQDFNTMPAVKQVNNKQNVLKSNMMDEKSGINIPDIPGGNIVNTPQFKALLEKGMKNLDNLSKEDQKRFEAAISAYPELQQIYQEYQTQQNNGTHPDLVPIKESFNKVVESISGPYYQVGAMSINPDLGKALLNTGKEMLTLGSKAFDEFYGSIIGYEQRTGEKISETVAKTFDDIGLKPLEKDDPRAYFDYPGPNGTIKVKMDEGMRVATNLLINSVRFIPELSVSAAENPGGFQVALAEFPFQEANIVIQAAFGQGFDVDEKTGEITYRYNTDKEVMDAVEELKQNPLSVLLLGMMAYGTAKGIKGSKGGGKVTIDKSSIQNMAKEAEKAKIETEQTKQKQTEAEAAFQKSAEESAAVFEEQLSKADEVIRLQEQEIEHYKKSQEGGQLLNEQLREEQRIATQKAKDDYVKERDRNAHNLVRSRKDQNKPQQTFENTDVAEIKKIQETPEGELRMELLDMQKEAKEPLSASDIANMTRNEVEYRVSGGKISLDKPKEPVVPKEDVKLSDQEAADLIQKREFNDNRINELEGQIKSLESKKSTDQRVKRISKLKSELEKLKNDNIAIDNNPALENQKKNDRNIIEKPKVEVKAEPKTEVKEPDSPKVEEKPPVKEENLEPISKKELDDATNTVEKIQKEYDADVKAVEELKDVLADLPTSLKLGTQATIANLESRMVKTKFDLDQAKNTLSEAQKRPLKDETPVNKMKEAADIGKQVKDAKFDDAVQFTDEDMEFRRSKNPNAEQAYQFTIEKPGYETSLNINESELTVEKVQQRINEKIENRKKFLEGDVEKMENQVIELGKQKELNEFAKENKNLELPEYHEKLKEQLEKYQEEAKAEPKSPAVEEVPIIKGKEVSNYLKEIGTDDGVSDYLLSEIKERNYKLKELSIDDILKQDEATRNYVLSGEIRNEGDYYYKDVYNPIIVHMKDGKYDVVDGYNRLTQLYKNGEKSVDAYLEVGKKIKKNKGIVTVEGTAGKGSPDAKATNNITSDKQIKKPEPIKAATENEQVSRNLAHTKQYIQSLEKSIADPDRRDYHDTYKKQLVEAKAEEAELQRKFEELTDNKEVEANNQPVELPDEPPKQEKPVEGSIFEGKKQFEMMEINDVNVDAKRFQGRIEEYSDETVKRIKDAVADGSFDPNDFDPIHVWKDKETGKLVVLSGHSRLEAMKQLGNKDIPAIIREFSTEAEAIQWATELSNRLNTKEGFISDVKLAKKMNERGDSGKDFQNKFGVDASYMQEISNLNPKGKFIEVLSQPDLASNFPKIRSWARHVGRLRKEFPQLTDLHEQQIFEQLYTGGKKEGLVSKYGQSDVTEMIEKWVNDPDWKPNAVFKMFADLRPQAGDRAKSNTREIQKQVDKLEDEANELEAKIESDAPEYATYTDADMAKVNELRKQADDLKAAIGDINERQGSFMDFLDDMTASGGTSLGIFGTPEIYAQLIKSVYNGMKGASQYASDILKRATISKDTKATVGEATQTMLQHHREIRDSNILSDILETTFKDRVPDVERWETITNAAEQGPTSKWWKELSKDEVEVANWVRTESAKLEQFVRDNEIMDLPDRNDGSAYLYHWLLDKNNNPALPNYGKFARSGPQFKQRTYNTIEELMDNGKEMVTMNPGRLLGEAWKSVVRVHQTKEMLRNLHRMEAPDILPIVENGNTRPAGMLESWSTIKQQGLEEYYTRVDHKKTNDVISKDIVVPIGRKTSRVLKTDMGVLNEVHPFVQSYIESPTYGKMAKFVFAAKGAKLFGFFHPAVLAKNSLLTGYNPFTGIVKGGKLLKDINNETVLLLRRNGLNASGFEDIGFNTKQALEFDNASLLGKAGNVATYIPRGVQHMIFDVIHPNIKTYIAHGEFIKRWPELRDKGLTRDQAAREVVRFTDQLLSGEDYKMALLESSRFAAKYYYSASMRKAHQMTWLSPTWQVEHIRMFMESVKASFPEAVYNKYKDIQPGNMRLMREFERSQVSKTYRKYLAGAMAMYTAYNLANYATTKYMDGEGKFIFQNEEGKRLGHVRLPFNHPDGTKAFAYPMKSVMEVPGAMGALIDGDFSKFLSKLNPVISETVQQAYNVDQFGDKLYEDWEDVNLADKAIKWMDDVWSPISVTTIIDAAKNNKSTLGVVLSQFSFPVSKGYQGGEWGKKLDDFRINFNGNRQETSEKVDQLIVDGEVMSALLLMQENGYGEQAMKNRMLKHQNRILYKWDNLSNLQKYMFLNELSDEEKEKFLQSIFDANKEIFKEEK